MSFLTDHKKKLEDLRTALQSSNRMDLKRRANGGNTLLFVYPPEEEADYLALIKEEFSDAYFIDVAKLFVEAIDSTGWETFKEAFHAYENDLNKLFNNKDDNCLFNLIIKEIQTSLKNNKLPFIIRSGALQGTEIRNLNIMEHKVVLEANLPLVFFYPAILKNNELFYLNDHPASRYRCDIIN